MSGATESRPNDLRLVFLGCGHATRMHSRTLRNVPGVARFYASRSADRAASYARTYGGRGSFGSYEAALADDRVNVALVATPPSSHLELALAALCAGKHVILEKPPLLASRDFDVLAQRARTASRRVFVAENYFYKPLLHRLRQLLAAGEIGEPRFVQLNALKTQHTNDWRDDAALSGGGALYEGGIHWIDFLANLGLQIGSVRGFIPRDPRAPAALSGASSTPSAALPAPRTEQERSILVVAQFRQGAVGTLYYGWDIPTPWRGLRLSRIFGSGGSITFESNGLFIWLYGRRKRLIVPGMRDIAGYRAMFRDFFDALRTGREPAFTLAHARADLELVERVYESVRR